MEIAILIVVVVVQLVISSGVLAAALHFTGEGLDRDVLLKCLGITFAAMIIAFVPVVGGILSIFVWWAAVMSVFEKSFMEAFLIGLLCWAISLFVGLGLGAFVGVMGAALS